jgi:hypothetical protein
MTNVTQREDKEELSFGGKVFTKVIVALLTGSTVVAAAGIFVITCIAAYKGVLWMWHQ